MMGEPYVEPEFVACGVGLGEAIPAGGAAAGLGVKELFGQVKRGGEKPGGDGLAEGAGEGFAFGDDPFQEIENAGEDNEVFHGCSIITGQLGTG